jgi:hypothetical protein
MTTIDWEAIRAPFPKDDLDVTVTAESKDKTSKMWATHITARGIQERLDDVVGPENWRVTYVPGPNRNEADIMCLLEIRIDGEWVAKSDGAEATKRESVKGGYSSAIKRAAVVWGIGRYLYKVEGQWLSADIPSWEALDHVFPRMPDWAKIESERGGSQKPRTSRQAAPKGSTRDQGEDRQERPQAKPQEQNGANPREKALLDVMEKAGVDLVDLATFLGCSADRALEESFVWSEKNGENAFVLVGKVKDQMGMEAPA